MMPLARSRPQSATCGFKNSRREPSNAQSFQAQWRPPAGRRATSAASCAEPPQRPPAPGSAWFAAGPARGCGHDCCRDAASYLRSDRVSDKRFTGSVCDPPNARTVPPEPMLPRHWPGSPPALSALAIVRAMANNGLSVACFGRWTSMSAPRCVWRENSPPDSSAPRRTPSEQV